VLWFTGLSGSGKSTIANEVEKQLHLMNRHTFLLDGDNVRHGLNKDLGFTEADRIENIRRVGEVAKLMTDAGLIVLPPSSRPFRAERQMVRDMLPEGEFIEIFVDTPLEVAEARDVKGLYKKARAASSRTSPGSTAPTNRLDHGDRRLGQNRSDGTTISNLSAPNSLRRERPRSPRTGRHRRCRAGRRWWSNRARRNPAPGHSCRAA
jgi:bifunctional enzyme CysN/CysC